MVMDLCRFRNCKSLMFLLLHLTWKEVDDNKIINLAVILKTLVNALT